MKLKELLDGVEILKISADENIQITGVTCDSRNVKPGDLFIAISGYAADGNRFIGMALEKGAAAVVTMKKPEAEVPYVQVASDRAAMAQIGCNFYRHPAKSMTMIGVTGTNGKTSVTWFLQQVLESITGEKVGLIGTVENHLGDQVVATDRTTPQSLQLQQQLAHMRDAGCKYAVMEVSSHAIDQERVGGIHYQVAAVTNVTQDHLDYHKTMENYCNTKAQLLRRCDRAVLNADDAWYDTMLEVCQAPYMGISVDKKADLYAEDLEYDASGIRFTAVYGDLRQQIQVPIPGHFTVYNVLTVLGVVLQLGMSLQAAAEALKTVKSVKGRMEVYPTPGLSHQVIIDFAHTPDGLEKILTSVRDFCKGRLIVVFGSDGDRDALKRPIMGKIAIGLSDFAVVTSDNPRTEDPMTIIEQIVAGAEGMDNYVVIENRVQAIRYAMDMAKKDDIIVLAGKGHETYQEIMGVKRHMDEREVLAEYLAEMRV